MGSFILSVLCFVVAIAILVVLARFDRNKWLGKYGEALIEDELENLNIEGFRGKTLRNIYLPKENGETAEVDVVYITKKGIFVFESKNYSGWIFGNEKDKDWTASLPNGQKNRFYNPIMQNRTHLKWMTKCVGEDIPLFSIIVFSLRCELKKVIVTSENIKVIKRDGTCAAFKDIWEKKPDALSDEKVEELYNKLKELTNVDDSVKTAHVETIEKRYLSSGSKNVETESSEETVVKEPEQTKNLLCPKCGSKLVLRTAKKGANAGNQFYGCSAFPNCRYIRNIG